MNWRTGVRIGLAAIALGVAATVWVKSRNGPPPPTLPLTAQKLDPNVSLLSSQGEMLSFSGDKLSLKIPYKNSRRYADRRTHFEGAVINGLVIEPSRCERQRETKALPWRNEANAVHSDGPFSFEGSDGVVEAEAGSYDDTTAH